MTVIKNSKVKIHYVGSLSDGTIFDKSTDGEPLEFVVGAGQVIPGFENALIGMNLNEEKKIHIKAQEAYGVRDDRLVKDFPKNFFPENFIPQKGMNIFLQDQQGRHIPATIVDFANENVKVDLNHPLAGKDLNFSLKVVGIE